MMGKAVNDRSSPDPTPTAAVIPNCEKLLIPDEMNDKNPAAVVAEVRRQAAPISLVTLSIQPRRCSGVLSVSLFAYSA
jgi:hypothetical protein